MACVDCKDNIINKTPSLIGEPKCGSDCPPETTCDGGDIASTCVYYSGNDLNCTNIKYGDTLSKAIQQLDSKYGVRVTNNDNCCGFLNDKLILGEGLVKEIVVQDNCEKLQITATGESCKVSVTENDDCCDYLANKFENSDTVTKEIFTDLDGCQKIKFNSTSCTVAVSEDDPCCDYLENKFEDSDTVTKEIFTDLDGCQKIQFNSTDEKVKVNSNDTTSEFLRAKFVDGAVSPFLDTSIPTAPKIKFLFKTITFNSRYNGRVSPIPVSNLGIDIEDGRGTPIVGEYDALSAKYIGWSVVSGSNTYNGVDEPILFNYDFSTGTLNAEGLAFSGQADNCIFQLADGIYNISISGSLQVKISDPQGVFIWYLQNLQSNFSTTDCRLPLVREVVLTASANTEEQVLFAGEIKGVVFPLQNSNCGGGSLPINRILMRIINATNTDNVPYYYDGISITFEKIG